MSEYAILRFAKLPAEKNVAGSLRHITRENDTPNADPGKRQDNTLEGGENVSQLMGAFRSRLPEKVRKNGVRAIECLVTGSPERMAEMSREEQDAYFEDAKKWVGENFGGAANVFCTAIHRDESTPHMHVLLVPMVECEKKGQKLSAAHYLDGPAKLTALQTSFAEEVGKKYGLERGIEGSKAKHQTVKRYYSKLNKTKETEHEMRAKKMLKKGVVLNKIEKEADVADRLAAKAAGLQREVEDFKHFKREAQKTFNSLTKKDKELQPVRDLSQEDRQVVLAQAKRLKEQREAARRAERESKRKTQRRGMGR